MECNKDEALRAQTIAEKKMLLKDFIGGRKILLKAQNLYPDLENISQMLTVCDIHCAAAVKINGSEDWYGILQVDPTADRLVIKKQYRKLALLLHPDKNKFGGAEAAFKLIGEAHGILSDQAKRSLYDVKRKTTARMVTPRSQEEHTNLNSNPFTASNTYRNHTLTQSSGSNQQQPYNHAADGETFWTFCPFCGIRFEYYRNIMLRSIRCQNCKKSFIAYDMDAKARPVEAKMSYFSKQPGPGISQNKGHPSRQSASTINQQRNLLGNATFSRVSQEKTCAGSTFSEPHSKGGSNTERDSKCTDKNEDMLGSNGKETELKFDKVNLESYKKGENRERSQSNSKRKRKRTTVVGSNDSESSSKSCSFVIEEIIIEESDHCDVKNVDVTGNPRRSTRKKKNISYNQDLSVDDDFVNPPSKRYKNHGPSRTASDSNGEFSTYSDVKLPCNERKFHRGESKGESFKPEEKLPHRNVHSGPYCGSSGAQKEENRTKEASELSSQNSDPFTFPDPEFYDFDKAKEASKFKKDQIWALYDDVDGMPRFYVRIRKVYSPDFMVEFSWLEHDPVGQMEIKWHEADLPVACGKFKLGVTESSKDIPMFSHPMCLKEAAKRNTYVISPGKGEIWALYKNWNIEWSTDPEAHKSFDYEIVEILSDGSYGTDIRVIFLVKVTGFVSVFTRSVDDGFNRVISSKEMLRFSHIVPAHKLSAKEAEGIPEGTYELDPASLPSNSDRKFPSVNLNIVVNNDKDLNMKGNCSSKCSTKKYEAECDKSKTSMDAGSVMTKNSIDENQHIKNCSLGQEDASGIAKRSQERENSPCNENGVPKVRPMSKARIAMYHNDAVSSAVLQFHDFQSEKNPDRFQRGQIWACYSEADDLPKRYALISNVQREVFKLHVTWLQPLPSLNEEMFFNNGMQFGCGLFEASTGRNSRKTYDTLDAFSHLVKVEHDKKRYLIYPHVGEVWAMYKNWSADWKAAHIAGCEYDLVEILASSKIAVKVKFLAKVEGFKSVFRGKNEMKDIPQNEMLRFSHCIPSFRLIQVKDEALRGSYELDPSSLPKATGAQNLIC